ncbi:m7GpppX diphosphatase [Sarcoptes scabiei]|nr:m7GpppX diphosphatase [Sarcoptes scabiei]
MSRRELQQLIKYNSPNFSKSPSHIHHEYSFNYELRSSSRTLRSRSVGTCFTPEISSKSKNGSNNCSLQTKSVKIVRKRLYSKTKCLESESITESKSTNVKNETNSIAKNSKPLIDCRDVAVFSTNNSTKVCKKKNFDTKDNNWESLLNNHINQIDLKDLEFQHKCLKNLMELITNGNHGAHIFKYLIRQIEQNYGSLPKFSVNLYPICRFNSILEPSMAFFYQDLNSPLNIIEVLQNVDFELLNCSRTIYALVFDYYQKQIE